MIAATIAAPKRQYHMQQDIIPRLHTIFVYGTLMKGYGNHTILMGAEFVGPAVTEPRFTMLNLGAFPGVVVCGDTSITGEIYRVNKRMLRQLDELEGHPDFYRRRSIGMVFVRGLGREEMAEAYVLPKTWLDSCRIITSGDWRQR